MKTTVRKVLVLGSYAFHLSPTEMRKHEGMTHKWTVLLRSPDNENLSCYIRKVFYELDPTFANSRRVKTTPPYEITETGWGEFTLYVKVLFFDESVEPLKLTHFIRLNPSKNEFNADSTATDTNGKPCVVSESFNEVIIHNPSDSFHERLMSGSNVEPVRHALEPFYMVTPIEERILHCRQIFREFQAEVQEKNTTLRDKAIRLASELANLRSQIAHKAGVKTAIENV